MADTPTPTSADSKERETPPPNRGAMPYYIAAFFLAAAMAWYFFAFVPAKLDYFVGVRMRALAVASSQVKSKAENLASAFVAASCPPQEDLNSYFRTLVPEIQLNAREVSSTSALPFTRVNCAATNTTPPAPRPPATPATNRATTQATNASPHAHVPWGDVMAQAAEVSRGDFDDLILARSGGEVVWQREDTTPRIGNLAQVFYADAPQQGWLSLRWSPAPQLPKVTADKLPDAVAATLISIGGQSSLLVVQAVPLAGEAIHPDTQRMYVAGLVSANSLQRQAMNVPVAWILLLSLPVILLFLALPFLKLATLTSRERFSFADAVVLLLASLTAASLAAAMPFMRTIVDERTDIALSAFAGNIETAVVEELRAVLALGQYIVSSHAAIRDELTDCRVKVGDFPQRRCQLGSAMGEYFEKGVDVDLDVVVFVNDEGTQTDKWSTKAQVTGPTTHRRFQHFRDLQANALGSLPASSHEESPNSGLPRFTFEPLRAPTTADVGVVVAFPLEGAAPARYLALNVRLRSLLDAVVPPDYGFAIVAPDGRVLFHSDENRSLQENFFEEVGEASDVRDKAASRRVVTWTGDYYGRPHRLHMRPLMDIHGSQWRIVTFRALDSVFAGFLNHQAGTFRLVFLNLAMLTLLALLVFAIAKVKRRQIRDLLNIRAVVQRRTVVLLLVQTGVGLGLLALTYTPWARTRIDWFLAAFFALPLIALTTSAFARRTPKDCVNIAAERPGIGTLGSAELALLVLLIAAVPAAGFARVVDRVQATDEAARWLEQTQQRIAVRNLRVLARLQGPAYRHDEHAGSNGEGRRGYLAQLANTQDIHRYAYLKFLPTEVDVAQTASTDDRLPEHGQGAVRFLINWNPFPSLDTAARPHVTADGKGFRLESTIAGSPALTIADPAIERPSALSGATDYSLPSAKMIAGILILGATIVGLYWARAQLLVYPRTDAPDIGAAVDAVRRALNAPDNAQRSHVVMVIGPPRTEKDAAVTEALKRAGVQVGHRIRLLDAEANDAFIDRHLQLIRATDPDSWVHVSNLETHLVGAQRRMQVLRLLEKLFEPTAPGATSRVVVVTTTVDPIAHFEEIFREERKRIYADPVPEVPLSRFAVLLTRFHRCYVPTTQDDDSVDPWWSYHEKQWPAVLKWETRGSSLAHVQQELEAMWSRRDTVPRDELVRAIATRAYALYQLLWTSCTRREKLALVQLAQEGFVTPQSSDVVAALMAKGLIVRRPGPAIFNHTFRLFLRSIERAAVVREWERGEGQGLWLVAGRLVGSALVAGGLFFLLTQGYSVETLLPVISGTGVFGVPLLKSLVARVSGRGAEVAA